MGIQLIQEKHQSKLFKKYHAFFAFNDEQFKAAVNPNFEYVALGGGLYAPSDFGIKVIEGFSSIREKAIKQHQATTTNTTIIWDELRNHEAHIGGELDNVFDALADYPGITEDIIRTEYSAFYDYCCKNDLF